MREPLLALADWHRLVAERLRLLGPVARPAARWHEDCERWLRSAAYLCGGP